MTAEVIKSNTFTPICRHSHHFSEGNPKAEKRIGYALTLTVAMMVVEIIGGWWFNSMAVLADGWHMSSHALALGLAILAYACARHYRSDPRFAFGTWKIEILASFASALLMLGVAGLMLMESAQRLLHPTQIHYVQAITIAIVGLLVNLMCAWWLREQHDHAHTHDYTDHRHDHPPHSRDLNQHSAYLHVLADAATSVCAIIALLGGLYWGANWLDPLMGVAGALLISIWAVGLIRQSAQILLDAQMDTPLVQEIRHTIENSPIPAQISDLHVWQVGRNRFACIMQIITTPDIQADEFHRLLAAHQHIVHRTIELRYTSKWEE